MSSQYLLITALTDVVEFLSLSSCNNSHLKRSLHSLIHKCTTIIGFPGRRRRNRRNRRRRRRRKKRRRRKRRRRRRKRRRRRRRKMATISIQ